MESKIIYHMDKADSVLVWFDNYHIFKLVDNGMQNEGSSTQYKSCSYFLEKDKTECIIELRELDPGRFVFANNKLSTTFYHNGFGSVTDWESCYDEVVHKNIFCTLEPNSTLIFTRHQIYNLIEIYNRFIGRDFRDSVHGYWKDNNIKVVYDFCFAEQHDYRCYFDSFLHEQRDYKHLFVIDSPSFDSKENFHFVDFGILKERCVSGLFLPWQRENTTTYFNNKSVLPLVNDIRMDNYPFDHTDEKEYVFSFLTQSPRPHRVYLMNKLIDNNINYGYTSATKASYLNYQKKLFGDMSWYRFPDNGVGIPMNKYFWQGFTKENYSKDWKELENWLVNPLGEEFNSDPEISGFLYMRANYKNREWDKSYLDILFESHGLFNLGFEGGSFCNAEMGILSEKFFIVVGANRFYKLAKEIGINTFLELFGLEGFDEIDNPYKQADEVLKFLLRIDKDTLKEMFISHREVFKENKIKLFNHFHNSSQKVQEFILT